jgi:hypothetical protein
LSPSFRNPPPLKLIINVPALSSNPPITISFPLSPLGCSLYTFIQKCAQLYKAPEFLKWWGKWVLALLSYKVLLE